MPKTGWLTLAIALTALPCAAQTVPLTIAVGGNTPGTAAVIGAGGGLCSTPASTTCTFQIPAGSTVTVAANAPSGQTPGRLSSGTGDMISCTLSTCTVTMTAAASLTATFTTGDGPIATLTTTLSGDGTGSVAADNSRCQDVDAAQASSCAIAYLQGSGVTLAATAAAASRFAGYSAGTGGAAACGSAATCSFTLNGSAAVTARFVALTSLALNPSAAFKLMGQPQAFTAIGTYSDGVSAPITSGDGTWTTKEAMPTPRERLGTTVDGGLLYAIGGRANGAPTGAAELYSPPTHTWSVLAPLPTPRESLAVAAFNAVNYSARLVAAIGGTEVDGTPSAKFEWYDPSANAWNEGPSMPTPRTRAAGASNAGGPIMVIGGEALVGGTPTAVGTVEIFNESYTSYAWSTAASMPTPRESLAAVVVLWPFSQPAYPFNTIVYAIGGNAVGGPPLATVEAYDTSTRRWSTKTPMPSGLTDVAAAMVDNVMIYVTGTQADGTVAAYRYEILTDTWSRETAPPTARAAAAGAADIGYSGVGRFAMGFFLLGGRTANGAATGTVEFLTAPLRWMSDHPEYARLTQHGIATGVWQGTAQIQAEAGTVYCVNSCYSTFSVAAAPTAMAIDAPAAGATVGSRFVVSGWALVPGALSNTAVDVVALYAYPAGSSTGLLLGYATCNRPRPDVAAAYGSPVTNSGFSFTVNGTASDGTPLTPGGYTIVASAYNSAARQYDTTKSVAITIASTPPLIFIDSPAPAATVTSAFEVAGWAADPNAASGTGVDGVRFYVQPQGAAAPGVLIGNGSYGLARPDVGALFGSRFTNSGYHFTITGLGPGLYTLYVYAHSTITGSYSIVTSVPFSVSATALMSIDVPAAEAIVITPNLYVGGWSIDRTVEGTALSGTGVDALHVYAYPNPGSGQAPIFLGVATLGIARGDVGAIYGSRYNTSGYELNVDRSAAGLAPGVYNIVVHSHSAVSGTFNNLAVVRVTLQ